MELKSMVELVKSFAMMPLIVPYGIEIVSDSNR